MSISQTTTPNDHESVQGKRERGEERRDEDEIHVVPISQDGGIWYRSSRRRCVGVG
jgi:hypothetical protein